MYAVVIVVANFRRANCCPLQCDYHRLKYYKWETASLLQECSQVHWSLAFLLYLTHWNLLYSVHDSFTHLFQYFMLCWPCISIYACNETNLMHYLSSVYSVTIPPHVLGLLVVRHQEVTMYICDNWNVLWVLVDCRRACMAHQDLQYLPIVHCYLWWWATSKPKTCRGTLTE
jgi:hypothetical protein